MGERFGIVAQTALILPGHSTIVIDRIPPDQALKLWVLPVDDDHPCSGPVTIVDPPPGLECGGIADRGPVGSGLAGLGLPGNGLLERLCGDPGVRGDVGRALDHRLAV